MKVTRLAPSPTGALHLGNARTLLVNWLLARQQQWKIILRIEDLDGPRIKQGADAELLNDLRWLGLDWDEGPIYQSARRDRYSVAIHRLVSAGWVYPCICSRKEVEEAASAPHGENGSIYPGTCRGRFDSLAGAKAAGGGRLPSLRFRVPPGKVRFIDGFCGEREFDPSVELGDFVIAKSDGTPAYQLAVVVDDAEMNVTDVVRGDDLLDSTPRQILLFNALGWSDRIPRYLHVPLVTGPDGRRLAKRHGDTRLSHYRQRSVPAGALVALLARWCGIPIESECVPRDLLQSFDIERMPRGPITFTSADDALLRATAAKR
jgi:glutamyl-tRNA synthetase